ncbi:hypothetical protein [Arthrobacter sp. 31Y]|uniref:hypothetical protein n=1 Tax=Arthrobacter sp. 31Y TaxID=1115632 RepID=UPI00163A9F60|nr:hypothetical protein [Arthrobacter sp. 31Y]
MTKLRHDLLGLVNLLLSCKMRVHSGLNSCFSQAVVHRFELREFHPFGGFIA